MERRMLQELERKGRLLEEEMKRLQEETARTRKARVQYENELSLLKQDRQGQSGRREEEMQRFEEYKEAEMKKLRRDRLKLDQRERELKGLPSRKEREEISEVRFW